MLKPVQFDTNLSEFTYTVARQATLAQKRRLPEKLFQKVATEKGAMRFATRSTREEKEQFFAYLGIENFTVYVDTSKYGSGDFREVFSNFSKGDSAGQTLKKLGEENVFITGSKQLAYQLGFVSQLMDSEAYVMNQQLIRAAYHPKNFSSKIHVQEYAEMKEGKKAALEVIKIINSVIWAHDTAHQTLGIDGDALRILLHYYEFRNQYLSDESITEKFVGSLSKSKITLSRKRLFKAGYVERSNVDHNFEFSITGKGILVVNEFRERVIKSLAF